MEPDEILWIGVPRDEPEPEQEPGWPAYVLVGALVLELLANLLDALGWV